MTKERFDKILWKVLKHNNDDGQYGEDATIAITAEECAKKGRWSPCDLILRECLNNEGYSAKGFLGLTRMECLEAYNHICECKDYLKPLISENGWNNFGIPLWKGWNFD